MEYFSKRCEAFVDGEGVALHGAELAAARKNPKAARCNAALGVSDMFCPKCGAPTQAQRWHCGCGQWNLAEEQFCSQCGRESSMNRELDRGVWRKNDNLFAERFDFHADDDVARAVTIQEGQCGLVIQDGAIADILQPGAHSLPSVEKAREVSLVLVETAPLAFPVRVHDVFTSDDVPLDFSCVVHVKFSMEHCESFLVNVMKGEAYVSRTEVGGKVAYVAIIRQCVLRELELAVQNFCVGHPLNELFRDAELRVGLERYLVQAMQAPLGEAGLTCVRLGEVEFCGEVYDKLRQNAKELDQRRRDQEFAYHVSQMERMLDRNKAADKTALEEYIAQLAHEKAVKDTVRAGELQRLVSAQAKEKQRDEIMARRLNDEYEQERLAAEQNGALAREKARHDAQMLLARDDWNAEKEKAQVDAEIQRLQLDIETERMTRLAAILTTLPKDDILTRVQLSKNPADQHLLVKAYRAMRGVKETGVDTDDARVDDSCWQAKEDSL